MQNQLRFTKIYNYIIIFQFNNFDLESYEQINSYVEIFTYYNENSPAEFTHYKVTGGQHEWFWNNWGFNTSEELVNFFLQYELTDFINNEFHKKVIKSFHY